MLHLAYRIFGSMRHHTISSALKISVLGKVGDVVEKRSKMLKKEQGLLFFFLHIKFSCSDNITGRYRNTPEINVTNSYILVDVVGVLGLV